MNVQRERRKRSSSPKDESGVSLVELIMVMLLLSIVIGIAAPMVRPEKFQMDGGLVTMASTLTAQQRNSVLRQHNVVLAIDSANSRVRVHYDLDNDGTVDGGENTHVVELDDGVVFGRGIATARAAGGAMNTFADTQDGMPALIFRRNGSASTESILYLTSQRAATAGAYAMDTRAIEIERATGRVRCYSFQTETWVQTC